MIETKEKVINGKTYITTQFMATHGLKMQIRIGKLFGAAIGQLATENEESLGNFLKMLFDRMSEEETIPLIKDLLRNTKVNNKDLIKEFDDNFAGNYMELFDVIAFVVQVNYGSFFENGGFGSLLTKILQPIET